MTDEDLRRVRVLRVGVRSILEFFWNQAAVPEYVALPKSNLPEGYHIVNINYEWPHQLLRILVQHPSFDPVPAGQMPPDMDLEYLGWHMYALATEEEMAARLLEPPIVVDESEEELP